MSETTQPKLDVESVIKAILSTIDKEREREIISRRYGLYDRRETLEQIGELLGITRERVRQLEKSTMTKLRAKETKLPNIELLNEVFSDILNNCGQLARISAISEVLTKENSKIDQSRIAFLARLTPAVVYVSENDRFFNAAATSNKNSEKGIREKVSDVIKAIKAIDAPTNIQEIAGKMGNPEVDQVEALASISKDLATLNGRWGLIKWPMVNPKNIRDKIYVILYENGKQMHFNKIAESISESDFKRKNVTTQAIHNELIKDKRFVLVGRGIYALKEWGFKKGTVSDVIEEVLKKAGEPLHRDEIVKLVLKRRFVKETTILLNLQGKPQFKRTSKATYTLADAK